MLIESLESRRLLSASPVAAARALAHAPPPAIHPMSIIPNGNEQRVESFLGGTSAVPKPATVSQRTSGPRASDSSLSFQISSGEGLNQSRTLGAAAAAAQPSYTIRILPGSFNPTNIAPFPAVYSFTLNAKNPLKLFNIKQTSGKDHLTFTATMNKSITAFSGVITVTGPNRSLHLTYRTTG